MVKSEAEDVESLAFPLCDDEVTHNLSFTGLNGSTESIVSNIGTVSFVFEVVLTGVVVVAGIMGNTLSFFALFKSSQKKANATPIILCALAIVDILFLLSSFYFQFIGTLCDGILKPFQVEIMRFFVTAFGVGHVCRMSRNWLVVFVSLERYIAVKSPLKAGMICTKTNARIGICAILLTCTVLCLPRFFEVNIRNCVTRDGSLNAIALFSELRSNSFYQYAYIIGLYFLLVTAGPCLILMVLNTLLILQIRRSGIKHTSMTNSVIQNGKETSKKQSPTKFTSTIICSSRSETPASYRSLFGTAGIKIAKNYSSEITRICIALVAVCVMCELPPLVYHIVLSLGSDETTAAFVENLKPVANFFTAANSGLNFYIYVFMGSRFRKHIAICGHRRRKSDTLREQNAATSMLTQSEMPKSGSVPRNLTVQVDASSPLSNATSLNSEYSRRECAQSDAPLKSCLITSKDALVIFPVTRDRDSSRRSVNFEPTTEL